jgi:hypothetical protein
MANNPERLPAGQSYDPFALARALDWCAKWWWGASLIFKLLGFVAGTSVVLPFFSEVVSFILAVLALVSRLNWLRSGVAAQARSSGLAWLGDLRRRSFRSADSMPTIR